MSKLLLDHPESAFILELRTLPKGELFIDVGASAGYYAINLADRFDEVWAIEPCSSFLNQLRTNIKRFKISNITVIEKAISDRSGVMPFYGNVYVASGRDSPSLKQNLTLSYEGRQKRLPLKMSKVETVSLSQLVGARAVDLIKVDTEGNELEVLWGALTIMSQIKAWHIESHDWREIPAITSLLEVYGFKIKERGMDTRQKGWLLAWK